jgi:predicted nucleotidyltransferase
LIGGLSERTIATLHNLFKKYSGIQRVTLYGSRAKGNYQPGSDIDITLHIDDSFIHDDLLHLNGDFDDSDMPYFVDVSIYDRLNSPDLKAHIDSVGKTLYTRSE